MNTLCVSYYFLKGMKICESHLEFQIPVDMESDVLP